MSVYICYRCVSRAYTAYYTLTHHTLTITQTHIGFTHSHSPSFLDSVYTLSHTDPFQAASLLLPTHTHWASVGKRPDIALRFTIEVLLAFLLVMDESEAEVNRYVCVCECACVWLMVKL
jgi:hypothetical protein